MIGTVFQFKNKNGVVTPALPVIMNLSSECAESAENGSKTGFSKSIPIKFGDDSGPTRSSQRIEIAPSVSFPSACPRRHRHATPFLADYEQAFEGFLADIRAASRRAAIVINFGRVFEEIFVKGR